MLKLCDTMREPGFSSFCSFGISFSLSDCSRYSVTTLASPIGVAKRSWFRNRTRSPTPAFFRFSLASLIRCGSMSIPTADLALNVCTAAIGMRPSPEPRS